MTEQVFKGGRLRDLSKAPRNIRIGAMILQTLQSGLVKEISFGLGGRVHVFVTDARATKGLQQGLQ